MIPQNIIEDIKVRNDIADVISTYVTLKRAGSNMNGLCPFHNEKTPSFTVFNGTQTFCCFGCGAAGDVITFIRRIENLSYVESLHFLAKRSGITIPEEEEKDYSGVRRSRILEMNKEAARIFRQNMLSSEAAKSYFISRGLNRDIVNRFGLGYSGRGFEVTDHLKRLGYTEEEMVAAKIMGKGDKGYFPYFRNRVMFPIIDTAGSVIGFGGRVMDGSMPKYLNTPDTIAFSKGRNLFALNFAKNHCAEEIILCEGYMDVIAMHAAGFKNAVATLGTALTQEQARVMKRYTSKVIISYDGDNAGKAAADRASKILSDAGLEVRVLRIKDAKDPDEYIKRFGADAFKRLLAGSETKFDFVMKNVFSKYDLESDNGKISASNEICDEIASVYSAVERELYTDKVAKALGLSADSLKRDIEKRIKKRAKESNIDYKKQMLNKSLGIGDRINPDHSLNPKAAAAEEAILGILMLHPERAAEVCGASPPITEDDFVTVFNRRVFVAIKKLSSEGGKDIGVLGSEFTSDEMGRIYGMQAKREGLDSSSDSVFYDNIAALRSASASVGSDIDKIIAAKLAMNGGN